VSGRNSARLAPVLLPFRPRGGRPPTSCGCHGARSEQPGTKERALGGASTHVSLSLCLSVTLSLFLARWRASRQPKGRDSQRDSQRGKQRRVNMVNWPRVACLVSLFILAPRPPGRPPSPPARRPLAPVLSRVAGRMALCTLAGGWRRCLAPPPAGRQSSGGRAADSVWEHRESRAHTWPKTMGQRVRACDSTGRAICTRERTFAPICT